MKESLCAHLEGVSGTFSSSRKSIGIGDWENSGYGLYMVGQMCMEFDTFLNLFTASGLKNDQQQRKTTNRTML